MEPTSSNLRISKLKMCIGGKSFPPMITSSLSHENHLRTENFKCVFVTELALDLQTLILNYPLDFYIWMSKKVLDFPDLKYSS